MRRTAEAGRRRVPAAFHIPVAGARTPATGSQLSEG